MDRQENGSHDCGKVLNGGQLLFENQQLKSELASKKRKLMEMTAIDDEMTWIKLEFAELNYQISKLKMENQQLAKQIPIQRAAKRRCINGVSTLRDPLVGLAGDEQGINSEAGRHSSTLIDDDGADRKIHTIVLPLTVSATIPLIQQNSKPIDVGREMKKEDADNTKPLTIEKKRSSFPNLSDAFWQDVTIQSSIGIESGCASADNAKSSEDILDDDCRDAVVDAKGPIDELNTREPVKEEEAVIDPLTDVGSQREFKVISPGVIPIEDGQTDATESHPKPSNLSTIYEETESMMLNMIDDVIDEANEEIGVPITVPSEVNDNSPNECMTRNGDKIKASSLEKPFNCSNCKKTFVDMIQLDEHKNGNCSSRFECDICSKSYATKYILKQHLRRIHMGDGPFHCDHPGCEKRFTHRSHQMQHTRTHTKEKPFHCDYQNCGKQFSSLGNLNQHKLTHTGAKPFRCDYEGCAKEFRQNIHLNRHKLTHTGEKPFQCDYEECGKQFSLASNLKRHKLTHTAAV